MLSRVARLRAHAYSAMLYLGTVAGILGGTRWAAFHGLPAAKVYAAMLLLFLPALIGARLLELACHWESYRRQPGRIWRRVDGGAALYGGLILSFLVSLPLVYSLSINPLAFWDAMAVGMLIGMVFTKVGCLLQGCCAGRPSDSLLAFNLPNSRGVWRRRLPAQLFEAGLAALLLPVCLQAAEWLPVPGVLFFSALAGYASGRWMLEPTRETIDRVGQWSLHRMISAALVGLAATGFVCIWILRS
jgi:phosphatidylglycerol---prolipoprotein diacylglyceryl transferase